MWRLEVTDWAGPTAWRWRLSRRVRVATRSSSTRWRWIRRCGSSRRSPTSTGYLQWNVSPDRRREQEASLLAEVGDWIGEQVLGPVAAAIGTRRGVVRLELPAEAAVLGYRPWELARVGGRSWAAARVRVVVVPQPRRPLAKNPVGERLRMLAVFSLPDGAGRVEPAPGAVRAGPAGARDRAGARQGGGAAGVAVRGDPAAAGERVAGAGGLGCGAPVRARPGRGAVSGGRHRAPGSDHQRRAGGSARPGRGADQAGDAVGVRVGGGDRDRASAAAGVGSHPGGRGRPRR